MAGKHVQKPVKKIGLGGRVQLLSYNFIINYVQGGSNISGTLSKPHCHISIQAVVFNGLFLPPSGRLSLIDVSL